MIDSGAQLFLNGSYYYRQLDDLALNLCAAKAISDADWREYLDGSLAVAKKVGRGPNVSLISFMHAHPNAGQRRMSTAFLADPRVRPIERVAVLTDSELLRGAMMAFMWLMPKSKARAFRGSDLVGGCRWLHEIAKFDEERAVAAWKDAHETLGIAR